MGGPKTALTVNRRAVWNAGTGLNNRENSLVPGLTRINVNVIGIDDAIVGLGVVHDTPIGAE